MNTAADTLEDLMTSWDGETLEYCAADETDRRMAHRGALLLAGLTGRAAEHTMRAYPDLSAAVRDAQRLAEGMAAKFAICRMAFGGGKAVIALPKGFAEHERPALLRRYGELIQSLGGRFVTAPDVGTSPADMDVIAETGAPYILARTEAAGGVGDSSGPTAVGAWPGFKRHALWLLATRRWLVGVSWYRALVVSAAAGIVAKAGTEPLFSDVNPEVIARYQDQAGYTFVRPTPSTGAVQHLRPCALALS